MSKYECDNPYERLRIPTAKGTIAFLSKKDNKKKRKKEERRIIDEGFEEYVEKYKS